MRVYKILDKEIEISTGIENAQYIENRFVPYIDKARELMNNWYSSKANCVNVLKHLDEIMSKLVMHLIDEAFSILNSNNIYTIDKRKLFDILINNCFDELESIADDMEDTLEDIDDKLEDAKDYRRDRKASRGRWVGGGFGLQGAITGAAQAGMMNAASGIGHSLVNAVGNITSSTGAGLQKSSLYSQYRNKFIDAAVDSVWDAMAEVRSILKEEKNVFFQFQSSTDQEKGEAIFNNYVGGSLPKESARELLAKALELNFYHSKIYETIWLDYGDENGDLEEMASFFGFSLENFKIKCVEDYGKKAYEKWCLDFEKSKNKITASVQYEDNIKEAIQEIQNFCMEHKISLTKSEMLKTLREYRAIADELKRTVEGVVYKTIDEAKKVRQDIALFNTILDKKNIFDADTYETLTAGAYLSASFKNSIDIRFQRELALRNPKNIRESIYETIIEKNGNEKIKTMFGVLGKCGNIEETREVFEQICIMQPQEIGLILIDRSIGLFSNKGKGKSGILFTNLNLRIFSKQVFAKENEIFPVEIIHGIEALGENKYMLLMTNGKNYTFEICLSKLNIREQMILAELMYQCLQVIRNIHIDQRRHLTETLVPKGFTCICGKYILKPNQVCPYCYRILNEDGSFTESVVCHFCGQHIEKNSRFCDKCGHKMEQPTIIVKGEDGGFADQSACPSCGQLVEKDSRFCDKCGCKMEPPNIIEQKEEDTGSCLKTNISEKTENVKMIECPVCKKENNNKNNFCECCGNKLDDIREIESEQHAEKNAKCPKCQNSIKIGENFCSKCGNKL